MGGTGSRSDESHASGGAQLRVWLCNQVLPLSILWPQARFFSASGSPSGRMVSGPVRNTDDVSGLGARVGPEARTRQRGCPGAGTQGAEANCADDLSLAPMLLGPEDGAQLRSIRAASLGETGTHSRHRWVEGGQG